MHDTGNMELNLKSSRNKLTLSLVYPAIVALARCRAVFVIILLLAASVVIETRGGDCKKNEGWEKRRMKTETARRDFAYTHSAKVRLPTCNSCSFNAHPPLNLVINPTLTPCARPRNRNWDSATLIATDNRMYNGMCGRSIAPHLCRLRLIITSC